jgi:tripartite-type tricarboxylate transporter receptor subunit TctC
VAETYPGFEATGWQVLVAPAGTPKEIIAKANADLTRMLAEPEIIQRLRQVGRFSRPMTPEQLTAFIQSEQKKWEPVQKKAGGQNQ